jgi:hypothetical protein
VANGSEATGRQSDENENSSGHDGNELVAEQCQELILQTRTSETRSVAEQANVNIKYRAVTAGTHSRLLLCGINKERVTRPTAGA